MAATGAVTGTGTAPCAGTVATMGPGAGANVVVLGGAIDGGSAACSAARRRHGATNSKRKMATTAMTATDPRSSGRLRISPNPMQPRTSQNGRVALYLSGDTSGGRPAGPVMRDEPPGRPPVALAAATAESVALATVQGRV
ncbi:MAG: hypothetical protein ABIS47_12875, partial [Acidimicrobiales bacterium]